MKWELTHIEDLESAYVKFHDTNIKQEEVIARVKQVMELIKTHNIKYYISDQTVADNLSDVFDINNILKILPLFSQYNIPKTLEFLIILSNENSVSAIQALMKQTVSNMGYSIRFFHSLDAATTWIKNESARS